MCRDEDLDSRSSEGEDGANDLLHDDRVKVHLGLIPKERGAIHQAANLNQANQRGNFSLPFGDGWHFESASGVCQVEPLTIKFELPS